MVIFKMAQNEAVTPFLSLVIFNWPEVVLDCVLTVVVLDCAVCTDRYAPMRCDTPDAMRMRYGCLSEYALYIIISD